MKIQTLPIVFILSLLLISGCGQNKRMTKNLDLKRKQMMDEPLIEMVESTELATLILKPQKTRLDISNDPFKPLKWKNSANAVGGSAHNSELEGYKYIGMATVDNQRVALLKNGSTRGTYHLNDKLKSYTIETIQKDTIILTNGDKTVHLKRSMSK